MELRHSSRGSDSPTQPSVSWVGEDELKTYSSWYPANRVQGLGRRAVMTALGHCLVALGLATQPPAGSLIPSTDIYLSTFYVPGPPLGAEILQ